MRIRLVDTSASSNNIKCVRAPLERLEGGRDILCAPDFERDDLEPERAVPLPEPRAFPARRAGLPTLAMIANRRRPGTTSRNSSSRLPARSVARVDRPVTLPPGRARLATRPVPTGSPATANTIGMADVACFAATTFAVPAVTMTSTLSRTNSAANSAKRSLRPSAQRYSIATVRPSIQPSSRNRCTKAAAHWLSADAVLCAQESDGRQLRQLLRARRERPRRRAAEQRDEIAPP